MLTGGAVVQSCFVKNCMTSLADKQWSEAAPEESSHPDASRATPEFHLVQSCAASCNAASWRLIHAKHSLSTQRRHISMRALSCLRGQYQLNVGGSIGSLELSPQHVQHLQLQVDRVYLPVRGHGLGHGNGEVTGSHADISNVHSRPNP